jgi:hypothetical protein
MLSTGRLYGVTSVKIFCLCAAHRKSNIDASSVLRSNSYQYRDIDCYPSCDTMYDAPPLPSNMSSINKFIESRSRFDMLIRIPVMPDNACRRNVVQSLSM